MYCAAAWPPRSLKVRLVRTFFFCCLLLYRVYSMCSGPCHFDIEFHCSFGRVDGFYTNARSKQGRNPQTLAQLALMHPSSSFFGTYLYHHYFVENHLVLHKLSDHPIVLYCPGDFYLQLILFLYYAGTKEKRLQQARARAS